MENKSDTTSNSEAIDVHSPRDPSSDTPFVPRTTTAPIATHTRRSKWVIFRDAFYPFYIRPYYRFLIIVPVLWVFMISANLTTYRNNRTKLFDLRYCDPGRYGSPAGPWQDRVAYNLPDLGFSDYGKTWQKNPHIVNFMDASPAIGVVVMALVAFATRDPIMIAEVIWLESVDMLAKAVTQLVTSMPDSYGLQAPCRDPYYSSWGSWIFTRVSTVFCGDLLWSGHMWHFLFSVLMLQKILLTSSYRTPLNVFLFRVIAGAWSAALALIIIFVRWHYSVDVFLSIVIAFTLTTHKPLINWGVAFLYRPSAQRNTTTEATLHALFVDPAQKEQVLNEASPLTNKALNPSPKASNSDPVLLNQVTHENDLVQPSDSFRRQRRASANEGPTANQAGTFNDGLNETQLRN